MPRACDRGGPITPRRRSFRRQRRRFSSLASEQLRAGGAEAALPQILTGQRIPADRVAENQRERLFAAVIEEILERGFGRASVLRVANRAKVSKETFYKHFDDRRDCLLGAYDAAEQRVRVRLRHAVASRPRRADQVRGAVEAALAFFAGEPSVFHLLSFEGSAADPELARRSRAATDELAAALHRCRECRPEISVAMPERSESILIESALAAVRSHLQRGEAAAPPALAPELLEMLLTPYFGLEEAKNAAAAARP